MCIRDRLKVVIEKDPFRICVYDREGSQIHADIPDLAYLEDSNHRRIHTSEINAQDLSLIHILLPEHGAAYKAYGCLFMLYGRTGGFKGSSVLYEGGASV